ncbi:MAG: restriction endonuclease [Opitutae bacterium]|nr:restriction endonuclease [Opitutae bacterium]
MNFWTQRSIDFANQRNYLDELFRVYPLCPELSRELDEALWAVVEKNFQARSDADLVRSLLALDLFPVKDSYVPYLRKDPSAIERNPHTIARICGRLYELGISEVRKRCEAPKETNRQIGPLFRNWLKKGSLGFPVLSPQEFSKTNRDAVMDASDTQAANWCAESINYSRPKGIDFVARIRGKIIVGEAKFLTDFGGHQNAQLVDALATLRTPIEGNAEKIVIADGVCYIRSRDKLFKQITQENAYIMSALCLRDFLNSL